jgi:hypothetical protein
MASRRESFLLSFEYPFLLLLTMCFFFMAWYCHVAHNVFLLHGMILPRATAADQGPPKHQKVQDHDPEQPKQIIVKTNLFELTSHTRKHRFFQYRFDIVPSMRQKRVNDRNEHLRDGEGKLIWDTVPRVAEEGQGGNPVALQHRWTMEEDSTPLKRLIIQALQNAPHSNLRMIVSDGSSMLFSRRELELGKPSSLYDFEVHVLESCGM